MTKLEVYRLALQTVERELDFWSAQIKARPYLKESLIHFYKITFDNIPEIAYKLLTFGLS